MERGWEGSLDQSRRAIHACMHARMPLPRLDLPSERSELRSLISDPDQSSQASVSLLPFLPLSLAMSPLRFLPLVANLLLSFSRLVHLNRGDRRPPRFYFRSLSPFRRL